MFANILGGNENNTRIRIPRLCEIGLGRGLKILIARCMVIDDIMYKLLKRSYPLTLCIVPGKKTRVSLEEDTWE